LGALAAATLLGGHMIWLLVRSRDAAQAANRAKTQFLANMSHEIRTPLNGVAGVAEALAGSGLDPKQLALVNTIRSSAASVDALLADILALSRGVEDGKARLAAFQLGDHARRTLEAFRPMAEAKGLVLAAELPGDAETWVTGDAERLSQILSRLISNAVKFTEQGQVTVTLRALGSEQWRFEVADTGVGFDAAHTPELFNPFAQSDASATR
jgi:signal transduction histidine kinase